MGLTQERTYMPFPRRHSLTRPAIAPFSFLHSVKLYVTFVPETPRPLATLRTDEARSKRYVSIARYAQVRGPAPAGVAANILRLDLRRPDALHVRPDSTMHCCREARLSLRQLRRRQECRGTEWRSVGGPRSVHGDHYLEDERRNSALSSLNVAGDWPRLAVFLYKDPRTDISLVVKCRAVRTETECDRNLVLAVPAVRRPSCPPVAASTGRDIARTCAQRMARTRWGRWVWPGRRLERWKLRAQTTLPFQELNGRLALTDDLAIVCSVIYLLRVGKDGDGNGCTGVLKGE